MADHSSRICAVIVSYFPDEQLVSVINALENQVEAVVVVDNGSSDQCLEPLRKLKFAKLSLLRNTKNLGIAAALNRGLAWARERGFAWVLTLDQDTVCAPDMTAQLLRAYRDQAEPDKVALLAPVHFDRDTGYVSSELRGLDPTTVFERNYVMTSGNLVPMVTFDRIGDFDESFFIDYVDHDFCLRAKKQGLRVLQVPNARMGHRVGNLKRHSSWFGFSFFSHNYRPERHYYRYRNRIMLYRRYFGSWILQDQMFALKELVKVYTVEKDRWAKTKAMLKGTLHGLMGRMGPI